MHLRDFITRLRIKHILKWFPMRKWCVIHQNGKFIMHSNNFSQLFWMSHQRHVKAISVVIFRTCNGSMHDLYHVRSYPIVLASAWRCWPSGLERWTYSWAAQIPYRPRTTLTPISLKPSLWSINAPGVRSVKLIVIISSFCVHVHLNKLF